MATLLKYTVLRLSVFGICLWLLLLAGAGPLAALLGGAVVSLMLSYVGLRRPREALSAEIDARVKRRHAEPSSPDEDSAVEDSTFPG